MNILDGINILKSLTDTDRNNLSLFCQVKKVSKGEKLFSEGDDATAMYILKEGQFEVFQNVKGKKIMLGVIDAEEILGEMALFAEDSKRMATAVATKDSELITILSFSVKEITEKNPLVLNKIKSIIGDREIDNKISRSISN